MHEAKLLALVYREKNPETLFRLVLPEEPCDIVELGESLKKIGHVLIDVGTQNQLDIVERNYRTVKFVQSM
jgi:hypothetical protein